MIRLFDYFEAKLVSEEKAKGNSSSTTIFHELLCAIALINPSIEKTLKTGKDVEKFLIANKKIVDHTNSIPSSDKFTVKEKINEAVKSDAFSLMNAFKSKFSIGSVKKIIWTGATNSSSEYGAADIVVSSTKGQFPISLKFGKGQLKNLSINTIASTLFASEENEDFISKIIVSEKAKFDELTKKWLSLMLTLVDKDTKKLIEGMHLDSWDKYQKAKFPSENVKTIYSKNKLNVDLEKAKVLYVRYFFGKVYEHNKSLAPKWREIKQEYFDAIFNDYFNSNERRQIINKNLKKLFYDQISSSDIDLYYAAEGGKKIYLIPSRKKLDALVKKLNFSYKTESSPSGYRFYIFVTNKKEEIATIDIMFRFIFGEMNGNLSTTSTGKINIQHWEEIVS